MKQPRAWHNQTNLIMQKKTVYTEDYRQHLSPNFEQRFWPKVNKTDSCWIWTGAKSSDGRGAISFGKGKQLGAHVASWIFHYGPVPEGLWVLHDCPDGDRGDCVNPSHLWLGNQKENTYDAAKKGRMTHKLTTEEVKRIRCLWPTFTTRKIATMFGVGKSTIWCAVSRHSWKHVK